MRAIPLLLLVALAGCASYNRTASIPATATGPAATTRAVAMQRRTVYFSGHVQGVGFRASVAILSREYDVAGEVRNLPDGRVELIVEGSPATIDELLKRINEQFEDYIRKTTQNISSPQGLPPGIRITY